MNTVKCIVTWFGSGLSPSMPGTVGTLATLPVAYIIHTAFGPLALLAFSLLIFFIGWVACRVYLAQTGRSDPSEVVIDESAGICLLLGALPATWTGYLVGFILFRFFDIVKPWPVSWADRNVKGALGVMLDDMLAGLYALPIVALLYWIEIL